jgi:redox-sensing transcriptional repressor
MERILGPDRRTLPEPTVARLPIYLRVAEESVRLGRPTISSEELARLAGVNAAKVRKDLSLLGSLGTRGTGYDAAQLVVALDGFLGAGLDWPVVIAGVGKLGRALINARGFLTGSYRLVGLVDADPAVIGEVIGDHAVMTFAQLARSLESPPAIGVITTPAGAAQRAAEDLVELGVRSILNFAPTVLELPDDVRVRYVDLSIELQILSYHAARAAVPGAGAMLSSVGIEPTGARPSVWIDPAP